jgi:DNA (cytosine-5)-methyltransferase 1
MAVYYNEIDPKAAAWLRELMKDGLIPEGGIDERSIKDVRPEDVRGFDQCHFFAGIGGWAEALRLAEWGDRPVWTGSCPCQPFSCAGKRKGEKDERHLWPAFRALIAQCRPPTVFGEQVASADGREWLARVRADLEALGYAVGAADLCAASIGAPHIRQRLYWVANAQGNGLQIIGKYDGWKKTGVETMERRGYIDRRGSEDKRLGDASQHGSGPLNGQSRPDGRQEKPPGGPVLPERMGDTQNSDGRRELEAQGAGFWRGRFAGASESGFWSAAIWHECLDGKARRISPEPALFPLAARLPGRVGLLRGAGNAIVPPLVAEFIAAFMETQNVR